MRTILSLLFLASATYAFSQPCATDVINKESRQQQAYHGSHRNTKQPSRYPVLKTTSVSIPVVFHVLYHNAAQNIPDSLLEANLRVLSRDFKMHNADTSQIPAVFRNVAAGTDWDFCLAAVDPQGNPTTGIVRKYTDTPAFKSIPACFFPATGGADLWPSSEYVNVVISDMDNGFYGWATYPYNAAFQGINVDYAYVGEFVDGGGRLLTHEMGHYFNLLHIWGDQNCGDDFVQDTPPQQGPNMIIPSDPCPSFPHVTCNNGPNGDNFYDYMDYSRCMSMFTAGQIARMQNALYNLRPSLLSSPAGCNFPTQVKDLAPAFTLSPNPSNGTFSVKDPQYAYDLLEVFDVTGRRVISSVFHGNVTVVVEQKGIYVYRLSGSAESVVGKMIVQ